LCYTVDEFIGYYRVIEQAFKVGLMIIFR
jgi:hypothetical protein